jgi:hypothetical protein
LAGVIKKLRWSGMIDRQIVLKKQAGFDRRRPEPWRKRATLPDNSRMFLA